MLRDAVKLPYYKAKEPWKNQAQISNHCPSSFTMSFFCVLPKHILPTSHYLIIRLFVVDFYEVIVDEAEGRINYRLIEIDNE